MQVNKAAPEKEGTLALVSVAVAACVRDISDFTYNVWNLCTHRGGKNGVF